MGSRDMAGKVVAGQLRRTSSSRSGVVAANQIVEAARKANLPATQMAPFHTPLVIASWEPIAKILVANGIAKPVSPKVYGLDMGKLTQLMLAKKKWKELKGVRLRRGPQRAGLHHRPAAQQLRCDVPGADQPRAAG
jgi:hypothetical protein